MEIVNQLKQYKQTIDPLLKNYLDEKLAKVEGGFFETQAIKSTKRVMLSGGKRIRPALVYYAYLLLGGKEPEKARYASLAMEFMHNFLLIHDDIIDRDKKRHGIKTIHEEYRLKAKKIKTGIDQRHFGNAMAIIIGDMVYMMGNDILLESKFSSDIIVKTLKQLEKSVYQVVPGEMMDIYFGAKGKATEKEIIQMQEAKTARYTFEGPLHMGAMLAEADKKQRKILSLYALPLGTAFQIKDDILGVFADEKKLGKPVGSDIREGKQTLLVIKTLALGNREEKKIINKLLGKKDITKQEIEQFRSVIENSGALKYSLDLAEKLTKQALTAIEKIEVQDEKALVFLKELASYIIKRKL